MRNLLFACGLRVVVSLTVRLHVASSSTPCTDRGLWNQYRAEQVSKTNLVHSTLSQHFRKRDDVGNSIGNLSDLKSCFIEMHQHKLASTTLSPLHYPASRLTSLHTIKYIPHAREVATTKLIFITYFGFVCHASQLLVEQP